MSLASITMPGRRATFCNQRRMDMQKSARNQQQFFVSTTFLCCKVCGKFEDAKLMRCSACKEVLYCSKQHQKQDWKVHRPSCRFVQEHPTSVWIEVGEGEGRGLLNRMETRSFENKREGLEYVVETQFKNDCSPPLKSQHAELLGYDIEIYCQRSISPFLSGSVMARGNLNSAGIYLGCNIRTGFTQYHDLSGRIFVTGRRWHDGKPLKSDSLRGILSFISDTMDYYCEDYSPETIVELVTRDAKTYRLEEAVKEDS